MSLEAGTRLGPYEILELIGAGGMGEVYRARDTKLGRNVALKMLPAVFASDPERLARFEREARTLASLNHPHIAQIYGFEGDSAALVMELVEGEDLAQRIARGPIAIDDALPIARQIAEALEAAHEQGIIHRDLKPAIVKVRPDGTVKVLDFGLAKALATDASSGSVEALNSPTLTAHATVMGVILGTAAYMAPEQAKGKPVDRRADIWAFGALFYEMLSGQRAFGGDDVSDTLAAVLRQDIDWKALPDATPLPVRHLIARCLERDPKLRLRDIGEARIVLGDPTLGDANVASDSSERVTPKPYWRRAAPATLAAIIAAAVTIAVAWNWRPVAVPAPIMRFQVVLPETQVFSGTGRQLLAISPDGLQIVYAATPGHLYLRSISDVEPRFIRGSDNLVGVASPAFSPDGQSVVFHAALDGTLKRIPTAGGTPVTICAADPPNGIHWTPEGVIFSQGGKGIMRVSRDGGAVEPIVTIDKDQFTQGAQLLPDREHLLFSLVSGTSNDRLDRADIVVQSLRTGNRTVLVKGGSDARYVPTGHLVYVVSGTIFAVPFDADRRAVIAAPMPVIEGVRRASLGLTGTGSAQFSFSNTGTLVYIPGPVSATAGLLEMVVADRKGSSTPLKINPGSFTTPRVSPDGRRVAFGISDGTTSSIGIYDVSGNAAMQRITFEGNNRYPVWADTRRIAFQSDREGDLGIFWQAADGTGSAERLTKPAPETAHVPESWSPNGQTLLFSVIDKTEHSLWSFSLRDRKTARVSDVRSSTPIDATFSPDGRWVAYVSTRQGRTRTYVQPFPATGATYEVFSQMHASDGPHHPVWAPDGKELVYNPRPGALEVVGITADQGIRFGNPFAWPRPFETGPPDRRRPYDMMPDGKLLGLASPGTSPSISASAQRINITVNWFEELKQRVPTNANSR